MSRKKACIFLAILVFKLYNKNVIRQFYFSFLKKSAFTLLEALVVISIISVMAVFGLPAFWRYSASQSLAGQANKFANDLRKAQQITVTEQKISKIKIANNLRSYQILKEDQVVEEVSLPSNIFLSTAVLEISFNFAGAPSQPADFIFQNNFGEQRKVSINAAGFVKVE